MVLFGGVGFALFKLDKNQHCWEECCEFHTADLFDHVFSVFISAKEDKNVESVLIILEG